MKLIDDITLNAAAMATLRRRIHAHPELGFEEQLTSDLVAEQLQAWGVEVHRGMAKTGVIGLVHGRDGGACGRAIGLRADMDALPMQEHNTFEHASRHPGTMHACGHDGHTTMLLAAARHLAATRDFDGTVVLIFQPAEEGRGGAHTMVAEGLFERYPMEAVFGMHNWPGLPAGAIAFSPGPVMAGGSTFKITVRGVGAHAALPHRGVDPVVVAAQLIQTFQTIISRNKKPVDTAVLSVTLMQAGEAINV
ncbi:MAG: amidohydrolase, partial [Rubrivivax sp.]